MSSRDDYCGPEVNTCNISMSNIMYLFKQYNIVNIVI